MAALVDELLAALPEVGLRVVNMGERPGLAEGRWSVQLSNCAFGNPHAEIYWATGATPALCLVRALHQAGVKIDE